MRSITTSAGGPVFMLLALGGWIYSLRMALKNFRQARTIDTLILTVFLIVTMALSLHGERFVLFATIPLSRFWRPRLPTGLSGLKFCRPALGRAFDRPDPL